MLACPECKRVSVQLLTDGAARTLCEPCYVNQVIEPLKALRQEALARLSALDAKLSLALERLARTSAARSANVTHRCLDCNRGFQTALDFANHLPDCKPARPSARAKAVATKTHAFDITDLG